MFKRLLRQIAGRALRLVLTIAGRAYVPGHRLEDALRIARRLAAKNIGCTLGYFYNWLEPSQREPVQQIAEISRQIIASVAALNPKGYLSIKAPAFNYQPGVIGELAEVSKQDGVLMHFDSHEPATADATLACVQHAVACGADVGLTIPGRWRRSVADADWACELGARVRVVKGEWADPDDPALDLRQGFLRVIEQLAGKATEVAVASHDPWLVRESLLRLRAAGTRCEIELLNGLPKRRLLALAKEFKVPVRVYIPFGIAWRPYALSKVANNPRMLWWVMRDSVIGLLSWSRRLRG